MNEKLEPKLTGEGKTQDFIRSHIKQDINGKPPVNGIRTRFPPEPNGYLHIGHAKSICLNFEIAREFEGATCNLRFDDTNPSKEDELFVESIKKDIAWLGYEVQDNVYYASDYFDRLFNWAVDLINKGLAYIDSQTAQEISENRGTPTQAGVNSPYRERSVEENLRLFQEMKQGLYPDGAHVLRAKIDMADPNLNMRDPVMYRIKHEAHQRTGENWCLYPMYDWAHGQSDAIERISHSICTLEFENHRPLYNWFLEKLGIENPPRQIEFARLNLSSTVTSKRILRALVEEGHVQSWDDPRMPTISGMRRRGYPASAIRKFSKEVGVTKTESVVDYSLLEFFVREELNRSTTRVMAVLDPVKLRISNYPTDKVEFFSVENNPEDSGAGTRDIPFSGALYIEREDCLVDPPAKFFRLAVGRRVRLKHAYIIQCDKILCADDGSISEIHCTYLPESRGGKSPDGSKVKGTIHWVSAMHAVESDVRLYDRLFSCDDPSLISENYSAYLNPLRVCTAQVEPFLASAKPGEQFQFLRKGYFTADRANDPAEPPALKSPALGNPAVNSPKVNGSAANSPPLARPVFNRTVQLRDTWAKVMKAQASAQPKS